MNARHAIFLLSLALATAALFAEESPAPPQVRVWMETVSPSFPYHRNASVTVHVETGGPAEITWPDLSALPEGIEARQDSPTPGESPTQSRTWTLDVSRPGMYRLNDLKVVVKAGDTEQAVTLPGPVLSARELTDGEKSAAATLVDPLPVGQLYQLRRISPWLALALIPAAAIALFAWRRRRGKTAASAPTPKTAWETALQRLQTLEKADLPLAGKLEPFYVDLSAILRYYIEDRFFIRAPEQTTQEFLEAAAENGELREEQRAFLAEFLRHCDRIKFARHAPPREECGRHWAEVRQFVLDTIPGQDEPAREDAA